MTLSEPAAVDTTPGPPSESPIGGVAIPIAILGILLSFFALVGVHVSLIPSFASLVLAAIGLARARRQGTSGTLATIAIAFAGAALLADAAFWALPHLFQLVADRSA